MLTIRSLSAFFDDDSVLGQHWQSILLIGTGKTVLNRHAVNIDPILDQRR